MRAKNRNARPTSKSLMYRGTADEYSEHSTTGNAYEQLSKKTDMHMSTKKLD